MAEEVPKDPVIEAVRADLLRRQQHGYRKYGGTLATNPAGVRGAVQHAYEETLDLCNYLKWYLMQMEGSPELEPDGTHNTGLRNRRRCEGGETDLYGNCVACFSPPGRGCLSPAADK